MTLTKLRNVAHDAVAVLGVLLAAQGVITQYLSSLSVDQRFISAGFGAAGLLTTLGSKLIDSRSYTATSVASITAAMAATSTPAPAAALSK